MHKCKKIYNYIHSEFEHSVTENMKHLESKTRFNFDEVNLLLFTQHHPQEQKNIQQRRWDLQTIQPRVLRLNKTCTVQGKGRSIHAHHVLSHSGMELCW